MILLGKPILERASTKHPQARDWLIDWEKTVVKAEWRSITEVRDSFPSADGIPLGKGRSKIVVTCFNVGGNDFRLLTQIVYSRRFVQVEAVLTHAEYSTDRWKKRFL